MVGPIRVESAARLTSVEVLTPTTRSLSISRLQLQRAARYLIQNLFQMTSEKIGPSGSAPRYPLHSCDSRTLNATECTCSLCKSHGKEPKGAGQTLASIRLSTEGSGAIGNPRKLSQRFTRSQ